MAYLVYTTKKSDDEIQNAVLKKFPKAGKTYRDGRCVKGTRRLLASQDSRFAWLKGLKRAKA
jgi:hypothetical protein